MLDKPGRLCYNTIRKRERNPVSAEGPNRREVPRGRPRKGRRGTPQIKRKEDKKMNANEIKKELERVEKALFYEQMADFMDWGAYYKLKAEKAELERQLKEIEG